MPVTDGCSKEEVQRLFGRYVEEHRERFAEAQRASDEAMRAINRETAEGVDLAIVETAPPWFNFTSRPDFFLERSKLAPYVAEAFSKMKQDHREAFRAIRRVYIFRDRVVVRYYTQFFAIGKDNNLENVSHLRHYSVHFTEVAGKEGVEKLFADYVKEFEARSKERKGPPTRAGANLPERTARERETVEAMVLPDSNRQGRGDYQIKRVKWWRRRSEPNNPDAGDD